MYVFLPAQDSSLQEFIRELLLFGCSNSAETTRGDENDLDRREQIIVYADEDASTDDLPYPREEADGLVREFAAALNAGDAERILSCMSNANTYYTVEWVAPVLDNYRIYFGGEKIEKDILR